MIDSNFTNVSVPDQKQTNNLDGSKVVPFHKVRKELFYPERPENKSTTELVTKMAVEVALCLLEELRTPRKATSSLLSSEDGKFSWGNVTDEMHKACIGKMASNDVAESPFAALTRQLQSFGRLLGVFMLRLLDMPGSTVTSIVMEPIADCRHK